MNDNDAIKAQVKEHYGAIASAPSASPCCGTPSVEITFNPEGYSGLGELGIADLGLGCGTPASFADLRPGQTVLDLGSGAGIDAFIAAKAVGPDGRAIGVDMTAPMIERARANARTLGVTNAEFRLGEIEQLPVESGSVDRILSNCVLNLVPEKRRAFREMFRTLKPGGMFAVSDVVTTGTMPEEIRGDAVLYASCVSGAIDRDDYLAGLREAGFSDVTIVREHPHEQFCRGTFGLYSVTVTGRK
jgi:SAM-dependent methyltransferase